MTGLRVNASGEHVFDTDPERERIRKRRIEILRELRGVRDLSRDEKSKLSQEMRELTEKLRTGAA